MHEGNHTTGLVVLLNHGLVVSNLNWISDTASTSESIMSAPTACNAHQG